jgi:hypothetical protein
MSQHRRRPALTEFGGAVSHITFTPDQMDDIISLKPHVDPDAMRPARDRSPRTASATPGSGRIPLHNREKPAGSLGNSLQ